MTLSATTAMRLVTGGGIETIGYYFYYPLENKIFVSQNAAFFENSFMVQEASGSHELLEMSGSDIGLELIQEVDTQPSENTSEAHNEHELKDLDEPPNYKATLADPKSDKWLEAMNTEMQSMKDNQVLYLVNFHQWSKLWIKMDFKKRLNMETSHPDADIRAIRILLAMTAFYDSEIGKGYQDRFLNFITVTNARTNTKDMVRVYGAKSKDKLKVSCYADANWKNAKQSTAAMFSTEAEYIVVVEASMEAVWMRKFIDGLRDVMHRIKYQWIMLCDQ
ncbi:retrotransposon protein, putative, ty1-copia subclass [Tanacetum coccineum]|uniref:Retrotransposon protein, putative, ty1-copia subclass n=1 Tax=Tanacetum coccineum TaxID=301880 RepID=A0ABQ5CLR3_9ASTR